MIMHPQGNRMIFGLNCRAESLKANDSSSSDSVLLCALCLPSVYGFRFRDCTTPLALAHIEITEKSHAIALFPDLFKEKQNQ